METNNQKQTEQTQVIPLAQEGYVFNNCSNCTINFYAEGKAVDVMMKKEENSERKMAMFSSIISPVMALMNALSNPSEKAANASPRRPSAPKRNSVKKRPVAKKAAVKKVSPKKGKK